MSLSREQALGGRAKDAHLLGVHRFHCLPAADAVTRYKARGKPGAGKRSVGRNSEGRTITPIEAVLAKQDVDKLHEKAEAKTPEPVRLDGLTAVRARGAAGPRGGPLPGVLPGGDGSSIPLMPRITRTIPAPYARPRIEGGHHGKTWAYAPAESVEPGDIVVDFGKVAEAWPRLVMDEIAGIGQVPVSAEVVLVNIIGDQMAVPEEEQLRVFRVQENS
jgi:hypothetical protein